MCNGQRLLCDKIVYILYIYKIYVCNEQPSQTTANPVSGKAGILRYIVNTYCFTKFRVSDLHIISTSGEATVFYQGRLSRHITPLSEKTRPGSWPWDFTGKATPFCHRPTAVTNCKARRPQQQLNPVSGKAYSSTKGGLLRYIHLLAGFRHQSLRRRGFESHRCYQM